MIRPTGCASAQQEVFVLSIADDNEYIVVAVSTRATRFALMMQVNSQ